MTEPGVDAAWELVNHGRGHAIRRVANPVQA